MNYLSPDLIRAKFSKSMSDMYQKEVPLYGDLIDLVQDVNQATLSAHPALAQQLQATQELARLSEERHGAIRLGTPQELQTLARVFNVMGMYPVGYYDLVPAGVPVHATAFRAIDAQALSISPFRVFTSLLRLELIENQSLRETATQILQSRQIFTDQALALTEKAEQQGGLNTEDAMTFVNEVLETFRWHSHAPVSREVYQALHDQHRLIADVVAFKGPHINHLTPRTLNIDLVQAGMQERGIPPKAVIEGPPPRQCPILLRQTSFKALDETVFFSGEIEGSHSARFGEIEQRGIALTAKGRTLYDQLLQATRQRLNAPITESNATKYMQILAEEFQAFPDSWVELHQQGLAYFYYDCNHYTLGAESTRSYDVQQLDELIQEGIISIKPIVYEDFLPVSAAGIFQSNLGEHARAEYQVHSNQTQFEQHLGKKTHDMIALYEQTAQHSLQKVLAQLNTQVANSV
ncbi:2-oxoadipate dioxygenase/decarboxylase HglS [Acinetobacter pseudolwoffii]|uniref:2-oxoadipate dioxygenase/decarboxylase HglS n=1 Tax=Acinetobacter pseudolwoffii TaxID=2053287 RepID=UPI0025767CB7|nr:VOC family protein [Acinetobacter pseudolwoffii]MDM1341488.1 VOC family protein [Acinetobacter pseudolwoffii]